MVHRIALTVLLLLMFSVVGVDAQGRGMMGGQRADTMPGMGMMPGMMGGMMGSGMMDQGMMQMMGQGMGLMATGGPGPAMILRMREALDLTEDQVARLEEIRSGQEGQQPHMDAAMQAHREAAEALTGDAPDFETYEASIREAADAMVRMHVEAARAAVAAREVLSQEQHETLRGIGMGMMRSQMMGPGDG
ncbi:MAG: Spy/CpxP family protein refolding chaperone [Gemmatimonadota bacterium]